MTNVIYRGTKPRNKFLVFNDKRYRVEILDLIPDNIFYKHFDVYKVNSRTFLSICIELKPGEYNTLYDLFQPGN